MDFIDPGPRAVIHCRDEYTCFWGYVAIISPQEAGDSYVFDCCFSKYSTANTIDTRLLLTYKSPLKPGEVGIVGAERYHYPVIKGDEANCTKDSIFEYLHSVYLHHAENLRNISAEKTKLSKKRLFLRWFLPVGREEDEEIGRRWGDIAKSSLVMELLRLLGYSETGLQATITNAYILHGIDKKKGSVVAMIGGHLVKLNNHGRLVDVGRVLSELGPVKS